MYSARQKRVPTNLNGEVFVEGNFMAEDDVYDLAHTPYTIYSSKGKLLRHVQNAKGMNDATPTVVALPPGAYQVRAKSKDYGLVTVPLVVEAGKLTTVHLQGKWTPAKAAQHKSEFVWLGYEPIGWSASAPNLINVTAR